MNRLELTVLFIFLIQLHVNAKLLFTIWIVRHGARTPKMPHNEILEKFGGYLEPNYAMTNVGMRQEYILGRIFQDKFNSEFEIDPVNLQIEASNEDRTHISGFSFLYGAVERTSKKELIPNIKLPIKVSENTNKLYKNTYPELNKITDFAINSYRVSDNLLTAAHNSEVCPANTILYDNFHNEPVFKYLLRAFKKNALPIVKKYFKENSYESIKNPVKEAEEIKERYETIRAGVYYDILPYPEYISKEEMKNLCKAHSFYEVIKGTNYEPIRKLRTHNMINIILDFFDLAIDREKLDSAQFAQKALLYHRKIAARDKAHLPKYEFLKYNPTLLDKLKSAIFMNHDTFLWSIKKVFAEVSEFTVATYFSSVISFELHENDKGKLEVKIRMNGKKLAKLIGKDNDKIEYEEFKKIAKERGTFENDEEFNKKCFNNISY